MFSDFYWFWRESHFKLLLIRFIILKNELKFEINFNLFFV